jgi:hypothetical protein
LIVDYRLLLDLAAGLFLRRDFLCTVRHKSRLASKLTGRSRTIFAGKNKRKIMKENNEITKKSDNRSVVDNSRMAGNSRHP